MDDFWMRPEGAGSVTEGKETGAAARDIVILAGLRSPVLKEDSSDEESMEELSALVETAGGQAEGVLLQNRKAPDPRTFIGEGKAEEIKLWCENTGADMVIFDNDLSPSQQRELTNLLGVQVLDRCALILDIFAQRARTKEGRLQVELAQYQYLLPRLTGMWTHLERQAGTSGQGPIGSKGPGETQLETDRRHIRRKIDKLKAELEDVRRVRSTQRRSRQRREVPVAAIVGYTNAGKSTLLNRLTGADIPANDRLFDTLDTTTRPLRVSDTLSIVVSDTVGFIRKLPHQLVEAFKATLEELEYADILLHVIDLSNPEWQTQALVVEELIRELGAGELPRIDVFNKCDALPAGEILPHGDDICTISAKTGEGIDTLLSMISARLETGVRRVTAHLPYDAAGLVERLYREAKVERVEYGADILVEAVCGPAVLGRLRPFVTEYGGRKKEDFMEKTTEAGAEVTFGIAIEDEEIEQMEAETREIEAELEAVDSQLAQMEPGIKEMRRTIEELRRKKGNVSETVRPAYAAGLARLEARYAELKAKQEEQWERMRTAKNIVARWKASRKKARKELEKTNKKLPPSDGEAKP